MGPAVVLDSVVPVQPDGLRVLIETKVLDTELLAENFDHVHRVSLHQVDFPTTEEKLGVQILETLQQEGNLVVFTVISGWSFSIKNKYRKQLADLGASSNSQALIVVQSQAVPKPENIDPFFVHAVELTDSDCHQSYFTSNL